MAVFGIGTGKFELRLNKTDFYPGEIIEGTALLTLNEELKARGVIAEFLAEVTRGSGKNRRIEILFKKQEVLDSERIYYANRGSTTYNFKFTVPEGIPLTIQKTEGLIGGIVGHLQQGNNSIKWFVKIKLDVPMAFDVSKTVQVRVTARPNSSQGLE